MKTVLLLGAGKIGRMIAKFLVRTGEYEVVAADASQHALDRLNRQTGCKTELLDASEKKQLVSLMRGKGCVISALSYHFNPLVADAALEAGVSYFDLTEDREATRRVREIAEKAAEGQIFMPQCGLAPGFISIAASHITKKFDRLDTVYMRVGALPKFPTNMMKYNLTWSTDGLINEYCNPCEAIHEGKRAEVLPLEGLEQFSMDGVRYEAFNTSGGLGTLCETLEGTVRHLNYKTVRYLGHRDLMVFLLNELKMRERRANMKEIFENAIPVTFQDVVVTFVTVTGWRKNNLVQYTDARKIYHDFIDGEMWSAIQITTAAGICAAVDMHMDGGLPRKGFVRQEDVDFELFLKNRFGKYYQTSTPESTLGIEGELH